MYSFAPLTSIGVSHTCPSGLLWGSPCITGLKTRRIIAPQTSLFYKRFFSFSKKWLQLRSPKLLRAY